VKDVRACRTNVNRLSAGVGRLYVRRHGWMVSVQEPYSARNASTGFSRAARIAGTTPAASPISTDTASAPKA